MATIDHNGKAYDVDEDGFLTKGMEDWDEGWVDYVKGIEGIGEMTDEHRKLLMLCRNTIRKMVLLQWCVSFPKLPASR